MKLTATDPGFDFAVAVRLLSVPVAAAAQLAIKEAGYLLAQAAHDHIHRVGFSEKWQHAYKVIVYPQKGNSIDAAAFGLFKGIAFSDIFGMGGKISGHNLLWLPFPTTPKLDRRKAAADVRDYKHRVKMVSFKSRRGTPLLAAEVTMTRAQASKRIVKLTASEILAGKKKIGKRSKNPTLVTRAVPLFHGVKSVQIKKRFDWDKVQNQVQDAVPGLYDAAITQLADK